MKNLLERFASTDHGRKSRWLTGVKGYLLQDPSKRLPNQLVKDGFSRLGILQFPVSCRALSWKKSTYATEVPMKCEAKHRDRDEGQYKLIWLSREWYQVGNLSWRNRNKQWWFCGTETGDFINTWLWMGLCHEKCRDQDMIPSLNFLWVPVHGTVQWSCFTHYSVDKYVYYYVDMRYSSVAAWSMTTPPHKDFSI